MNYLANRVPGFFFWVHVLIMALSWLSPFLISWKILLPIYGAVMLQFAVFGQCLLNKQHGFVETGDRIFYVEVLEKMGFHPNPRLVKTLIWRFLYPFLATVAIIWQRGFDHAPLLF